MSLGGWMERWLVGDSKIKDDSKGLSQWGDQQFGTGSRWADAGVEGLQSDAEGYAGRLASGRALPDSVYRAYDATRGRIGDEATRSIGAVQAGIAQKRAQGGGLMSDEAGMEYQRLGERDVRDTEFTNLQGVGIDQAHQELGATQDLMSRLDAARNNILNYGEFMQQIGYDAKARGIANRITRAQSIGSAGQSAGSSFSSANINWGAKR